MIKYHSMEPHVLCVYVCGSFEWDIYVSVYLHIWIYMYICVYMYICILTCICMFIHVQNVQNQHIHKAMKWIVLSIQSEKNTSTHEYSCQKQQHRLNRLSNRVHILSVTKYDFYYCPDPISKAESIYRLIGLRNKR